MIRNGSSLLIDEIENIISKFTCVFFFTLQIFKQNCNEPNVTFFKEAYVVLTVNLNH